MGEVFDLVGAVEVPGAEPWEVAYQFAWVLVLPDDHVQTWNAISSSASHILHTLVHTMYADGTPVDPHDVKWFVNKPFPLLTPEDFE